MEGYVIVLDVDGTLLPSNNEITSDLIDELKHYEENNIVVLASGRGYHDLSLIHQKLNLKGPIISSNGASLDFFDGTPSVTMAIRNEIIKDIFKHNRSLIKSAFFSYNQKLFIFNRLEKLNFLYKIKPESKIIEGPFDEIALDHPNSLYFILNNDLKEHFFSFCQKYSDEIEVNEFGHDRSVSIVTINLKHTDKAYAILELLMILNKHESDTIIFGDNYADINMLKLNGLTVAMSNSIPEVIKTAKYVTDEDNNHNGVIKFLQKIEKGL